MTSDQIHALIATLRRKAAVLDETNECLRDQIIFLANQAQQLLPNSIALQSEICMILSFAVLRQPVHALDRLETIVWEASNSSYAESRQPSVWLDACNSRKL